MRNEPESNQRDIDYIKYPAWYLIFALKEGENKPEKAKKWITFLCIKIKPDHSGLGLKTIDGGHGRDLRSEIRDLRYFTP